MATIIDVIEKNILQDDVVEFHYIKSNSDIISKNYIEIINDAKKISSYLIANFESQSRILLVYQPGLEFISSFIGCLYAGMVAVPAYPLQNRRQKSRLENIITSCKPTLLLATDKVILNLQNLDIANSIDCLDCSKIINNHNNAPYEIERNVHENMLAFLQYTSGSTGNPKGVMVSHGNLKHNLETLKDLWSLGPNKTTVFWLPFQHDLGLIGGVLSSIFNKNELVLLAPVSVVQNPYLWLKTLSDYKAFFTAGPNFSYQLCVDKISNELLKTLDLSYLGYAVAAAEPNRVATMELFCDKFSKCGFKKEAYGVSYGLAEGTLCITANKVGCSSQHLNISKKHLAKSKVEEPSCNDDIYKIMSAGELYYEHEVKIVDPKTCMLSSNNVIGEIWVSSQSVAKGYWKQSNLNKEIFQAKIDNGNKLFLRTGDLGFIKSNQLYMTGRVKDLIIIDGVNIYPQDLEVLVEDCHEHLQSGSCAVFSYDNDIREEIVVSVEVKRTSLKKDLSEVVTSIRQAIAQNFEVSIYDVKLLKPNRSLKTTSGKIQRKATKQAYINNELVCVKVIDKSDISYINEKLYSEIKKIYCDVLSLATVGDKQRFTELGGTSLHATSLYNKLKDYLGENVSISQTIAFDCPTLDELTIYIAHKKKKIFTKKVDHSLFCPDVTDKVAIIGVGCRLPGKVNNLDDLWKVIESKLDLINDLPEWRWDLNHLPSDLKSKIQQASYLDEVEFFDAAFFNISPNEAKQMDPRHRIMLQVVWHALEDSGIKPSSLESKNVSVFLGCTGDDYKNLMINYCQAKDIDSYFVLDTAMSLLAGRISYFLGINGVAQTIDTACSSSLVAIDNACNSLLSGQSDLAISGGVNLILHPDTSIGLVRANMLSPTNRCHTFSEQADGYVRGEGCGVVILKRLSDAIKDNDYIHAVINSSVVNQDGASSGITVPNRKAQSQLICNALTKANLQPNDINYIEAHGSATQLGDPIEIGAINDIFSNQNRTNPLYVGSIKSNYGHLEAASGIIGLLKSIASIKNRTIPANINFTCFNDKLEVSDVPISVLTRNKPLTDKSKLMRLGVSSFGFSGTNAHIIIEEPPASLHEPKINNTNYLFILSAKCQFSLESNIKKYLVFLDKTKFNISDICYAAAMERELFLYKLAIIIKDKDDLIEKLKTKQFTITNIATDIISKDDANIFQVQNDITNGYKVDLSVFFHVSMRPKKRINLPVYSFYEKKFWLDIVSKDNKDDSILLHKLLGKLIPTASNDYLYINKLHGDLFSDYPSKGGQSYYISLAILLETIIASAKLALEIDDVSFTKIEFHNALGTNNTIDYQTRITPSNKNNSVKVSSKIIERELWNDILSYNINQIALNAIEVIDFEDKLSFLKPIKETHDFDSKNIKSIFNDVEVDDVFIGENELFMLIEDNLQSDEFYLNPNALKKIFKSVSFLAQKNDNYFLSSINKMVCYQKIPESFYLQATIINDYSNGIELTIKLFDKHGIIIALFCGCKFLISNKEYKTNIVSSYVTSFLEINLPEPSLINTQPLVVQSSDKLFKELSDSSQSIKMLKAASCLKGDLIESCLIFIYENNLYELVAFIKNILIIKPKKLILVTQNAFAICVADKVNIEHRMAVGLWLGLIKEINDIPCILIDTNHLDTINEIISFVSNDTSSETQYIVREQLYVPRLIENIRQKIFGDVISPLKYKANAGYLIIIDSEHQFNLAKYLINNGAGRINIVNQLDCKVETTSFIEFCTNHAVDIKFYDVNINNKAVLKELIESCSRSNFPLKGIFYGKFLLEPKVSIHNINHEIIEKLKDDINLVYNLHQLSMNLNLDCFVLMSSMSKVMASFEQSLNVSFYYYLNGLSEQRSNLKLPSLTVSFAVDSNQSLDINIKSIQLDDHFSILGSLIADKNNNVFIANDIDWKNIVTDEHDSYLSNFKMDIIQSKIKWFDLLLASSISNRSDILQSKISDLVILLLGLTKETMTVDENFFNLGMNSIVMMTFISKIQYQFDDEIKLTPLTFIQNNNVLLLSDYIILNIKRLQEEPVMNSNMVMIEDDVLDNNNDDNEYFLASEFLVKPNLPLNLIDILTPSAFINAAYGLWRTPNFFSSMSMQKSAFKVKIKNTFKLLVENISVQIYTYGKGPRVLFIHGWAGQGNQVECYIEPLVKLGYEVVSFDLPCHGVSGGDFMSIEMNIKVILSVINYFNSWQIMIGHSMGALLGTYCLNETRGFNKVILLNPAPTITSLLKPLQKKFQLNESQSNQLIEKVSHDIGLTLFKQLNILERDCYLSCQTLVVHDDNDLIIPEQSFIKKLETRGNIKSLMTNTLSHYQSLSDQYVISEVIKFIDNKIK